MKNERGSAMLEFAVVLPFLLIVVLGLVDVVFTIQKSQYMSVMVREIGNNSYRKCKDSLAGTSSDNCLKISAEEVVSFASGSTLSDVEVLVQAWDVPNNKGATGPTTLKGSFVAGKNIASSFNKGVIMNLSSYDSKLRNTLITVELLQKNDDKPFYSFARNMRESMIF